ncbi:avidin/streptavidin family protein [Streptomyces sp. NPDC017958]|uniref:avidin/streptavidin family protein n=1 Tax=Streptomyces sp. NPDC017958 TaxID=3365021 RepID=UPI0037BA02F0
MFDITVVITTGGKQRFRAELPQARTSREKTMPIDGEWYNEFGSKLHLEVDQEGTVSGRYVTAVGHAPGTYLLTGRHDGPTSPGNGIALGWTVAWRNEQGNVGSVTSWSGQFFADPERILSTWLLTRSAMVEAWESTVVGQDVFTRQKPTGEDVDRALRSGRPVSHPMPA